MKKRYSAAVIGLGRAGYFYDAWPSEGEPLRSHAAAYLENDRIDLIAVVDTDSGKREKFLTRCKGDIASYSSIEEMFSKNRVDILSVCTPANSHYHVIKESLAFSPRVIFCEKPFTSSYDGALEISRLAVERGIAIAVNYHRRWDPDHQRFLEHLRMNGGKVLYFRCLYNKGLYNYASHMIDLVLQNIPAVEGVQAIRDMGGGSGDDNISFSLFFDKGRCADIIGIQNACYDLFEMEVFTTTSIYTLRDGGVEKSLRKAAKDAFYPGYTHAIPDPDFRFRIGPVGGLREAVRDLVELLDNNACGIKCDASNALEVHKILEAVKESVEKKYSRIDLEGKQI